MSRDPVGVVVPTRNRPEMLAHCLAALRAELDPADEVVVVDSASDDADAVARVVASEGARLVRCDVKGASRARNAGWRSTDRELVVFVDDDVQVHQGWAAALVAAASSPEVAFVAGRTVASGAVQSQLATVTWGRPAEVIDRNTRGAFAASNNLLVRRSALLRTGGFDERLGPGTWLEAGEDLELLDRVLATGDQGRYAHDAVASHEQWRDARAALRLQLSYGKGMGARFSLMLRRDPRRARQQVNELLRLGGLLTLLRRFAAAGAASPEPSGPAPSASESTGFAGPLLWRFGALVGLVVGLFVLRPAPRSRA
jgi:glycosyltransferase involved in cell wall biosynthesis